MNALSGFIWLTGPALIDSDNLFRFVYLRERAALLDELPSLGCLTHCRRRDITVAYRCLPCTVSGLDGRVAGGVDRLFMRLLLDAVFSF